MGREGRGGQQPVPRYMVPFMLVQRGGERARHSRGRTTPWVSASRPPSHVVRVARGRDEHRQLIVVRRAKAVEEAHLPALAEGLRVGALLLAGADNDVDESAVVLQTLLRAAGQPLAGLLALGDLRGLATHLTGTSERSVDLSLCTRKRRRGQQRESAPRRLICGRRWRPGRGRGRDRPFCSL